MTSDQQPDPELKQTAREVERSDETGEQEFFGYPEDYVFAIFKDDSDARAGVERIAQLGLTDDEVATFAGEEGAQSLDSDGEEHGLGARLLRIVQQGAANVDHLSEYERAAAEGQVVVGVYVPDEDQREQVTAVLLDYDTRAVNFFGKLVVETLRP